MCGYERIKKENFIEAKIKRREQLLMSVIKDAHKSQMCRRGKKK